MAENLIVDTLRSFLDEVYPRLPAGDRSMIDSDLFTQDECMAIDDMLQFALIRHVAVASPLLDRTEETIDWFWDAELTERTRGWIAQHRIKSAA